MLFFYIFPIVSRAYSLDTSGMNSDVADLIYELENNWPEDLDENRLEVIRQAGLLINKGTKYLLGGGHTGTCETGIPSYLDCSGYVSLVFHRAGVNEVLCGWTTADFAASGSFENINEFDLKPGDIALNNDSFSVDNHVGIFVGKKNGANVWFHSSKYNGVSGPQVRYGNGNFKVFKRYLKWDEVYTYNYNNGIGGELGGRLNDPYMNFSLESDDNFSCENIFYTVSNGVKREKTLKKILDFLFNIMTVGAPLITIVLTIIDYIKIIVSNNFDGLKKVNKKTIKRMVITILIVFLPFLLQLLFNIFGLYDLSNCGIS